MSKQITIKKTEYERVEKEIPFNIPEEILYFFIFGKRVSVKVTPVWTTWNKEYNDKDEEIWLLHVTLVKGSSENVIESKEIQVSHIPDFINKDNIISEILELVNDPDERCVRTKEDFENDFENDFERVLEKIVLVDKPTVLADQLESNV